MEKSKYCTQVLQLMDQDNTYQQAMYKTMLQFTNDLHKELENYI